jgi:hypothetical protein
VGRLIADRLTVVAPHRDALLLERARIDGPATFIGLHCEGRFRAFGAEVTQPVVLNGACISRVQSGMREQPAVSLDQATLVGGLYARRHDEEPPLRLLDGGLSARGAVFGSNLELWEARIHPQKLPALSLLDATIRGDLVLDLPLLQGTIDLRGATVDGALQDHLEAEPPEGLVLLAEGFRFGRFVGDGWSVERRKRWLRRTAHFEPGFYDTVARAYRHHGLPEDARQIAIAREERATEAESKRVRRLWRRFLGFLTVYGYRPGRTLLYSALLVLALSVGVEASTHVRFVPSDTASTPAEGLVAGYPGALLYTVDAFVPLVDLGAHDQWQPRSPGDQQWLLWWNISLQALGWILITIFATGFTAAAVRSRDG